MRGVETSTGEARIIARTYEGFGIETHLGVREQSGKLSEHDTSNRVRIHGVDKGEIDIRAPT